MSAIYLILTSLLSFQAHGAFAEVPVSAEDRIVVVGLDAQISFTGQKTETLRVQGLEESGEGRFVLTKRQNTLELKMVEPGGKRNWLSALTRPVATKKIEIHGLAIPVEIQLRNGNVTLQNWDKSVKATLSRGRFSSTAGNGDLTVAVQDGDILIKDHSGRVRTDSYSGSTSIVNLEGDGELSVFSGQLTVERARGNMSLITQQANSKINASSGTLQFDSGKGNLSVTSYQGRMEGQSSEGNLNIHMAMDSELDVRTKTGWVAVQTPANSGMNLNLLSNEGNITVPSPLRVTRLSNERSVRGRLRGDAQRGSVFVRSQEGAISVK